MSYFSTQQFNDLGKKVKELEYKSKVSEDLKRKFKYDLDKLTKERKDSEDLLKSEISALEIGEEQSGP